MNKSSTDSAQRRGGPSVASRRGHQGPASRRRHKGRPRSSQGAGGGQRGVALVELLLITVPLCCLSIVLASAIAATSSSKTTSMWKASLQTQLATTQPCGGTPLLAGTSMSPKQGQFSSGYQQAQIIADEGLDLTLTNSQTRSVTEPVPKFYFENAADQMFPNRTQSTQNSATFLCNEPNNGDSRRDPHLGIVYGTAFLKSQELYQ